MLANPAAIFVKGHISNPVEPIFNRPVLPIENQQAGRVRFLWTPTGNPVDRLGAEFCGDDLGDIALDTEDLSGVREIEVIVQLGAGPDVADFQTAMRFIGRGVLRGETL